MSRTQRAMTVPWSLLWILGLICSSDSSCSPTSYYKSCWIRRFPGLYVDIEESQRRGAHILKVYQEESALTCSRSCCLTPNFSCNLAVFHFNTTQDSVNCFHLQCATAESCVPQHRRNVILYNVTKGVDPDLLVFGKHFTTNVRVLPHMSSSRLNVSEPLTSDKRHFNYPPNPPIRSTSTIKPPTLQQTTRTVPTTLDVQHKLPQCTTIPTTATQSASEHVTSTTSLDPQQATSTSQTNRHTQTISQTAKPETTTDALNHSLPTPSLVHTTTSSTTDDFDSTLTSIPINKALSSSTTQQPLGLQTTSLQTTKYLATSSQNTSAKTSALTLTSNKSTSAKSEEYPETTAQTTVFKTLSAQTSASSQSETLTSSSANALMQTSTHITHAYETRQAASAQSTFEHVISTSSQPKTNPMHNPQQTTTTPQWTTTKLLTSANMPFKTTQSPADETSTWALQTPTQTSIPSQPKHTISTSPTIPTVDSTTPRPLTLTFTHTHIGNSATTGSLSSSLTVTTSSMMDSQPYSNDTKGYISRNITTGDAQRPAGDGSLTSVWHLAANTVLVALATCATITFGCCCLVFAALSWRGQRRRKGRYRTNLRGKRGSMRLIKYVIVRESS